MTQDSVCSKEINEEIQRLVDINELQDDSDHVISEISEIKWSQPFSKYRGTQAYSEFIPSKTANDLVRQKWYNHYTVPKGYVDINASSNHYNTSQVPTKKNFGLNLIKLSLVTQFLLLKQSMDNFQTSIYVQKFLTI